MMMDIGNQQLNKPPNSHPFKLGANNKPHQIKIMFTSYCEQSNAWRFALCKPDNMTSTNTTTWTNQLSTFF
ncbi:MAG: hypothetical protein ACI9WC_003189 [Arenicella sp.]|jgi:hypothetical protein